MVLISFVLLTQGIAIAQKNISPTDTLFITGKIKANIFVTLADLQKFPSSTIPDLVITDHTGAAKKMIRELKGFPVKQLLEKAELQAESPKLLSEFYFTFTGSDGYKVVYSWNELFNTETGNTVYVVTSKDGTGITAMDDHILVISTKDFKTGRRHVKGLSKILAGRAE